LNQVEGGEVVLGDWRERLRDKERERACYFGKVNVSEMLMGEEKKSATWGRVLKFLREGGIWIWE
jgi:hypothetical protein